MIQRRKPLPRATKPIKRATAPRKRRPGPPRRGPQGIPAEEWRSPAYRAWLHEEGKCRACQIEAKTEFSVTEYVYRYRAAFRPGWCDPAHTENGGLSMKGPDSSCAPLCRGFGLPNHHDEYDADRAAFVSKYGYDPKDEAVAHWAAFKLVGEREIYEA